MMDAAFADRVFPAVPDVYRHIAPVYDVMAGALLSGPHGKLAEVCHGRGARRVLDMGCGTGLLAARLCKLVPQVVGLDMSRAMLHKAARRRSCNCPFSLVLADAAFPPFPRNSFDAVTFSLVLHETGARAEQLLETAFFLAPLVIVLEWRAPERNLDYLPTAWPHLIERLAGREHYRGFRQYMRRGGLYGLAHRAGARVEEAVTLRAGSLILVVLSREQGRE